MNTKRNKKMVKLIALILAVGITALTGCASSGAFRGQATSAEVSLTKKNYKVIKVGAKGESSGFRLLGIIPISSPNYAEAKEALYKSVEGSLEGRAIALVNQTEDVSTLYLILFSIPKVTISADIIEYIDEP